MKRFLILVSIIICTVSCKTKTVQEDGGLIINIEFVAQSLSTVQKEVVLNIIKSRATNLSRITPNVLLTGNAIQIELPEEYDSILYKKMLLQKGSFEINKTYILSDIFENLNSINDEVNMFNEKDSVNLYSLLSLNVNDKNIPANEPILGFALTADTLLVNKVLSNQKSKGLLPKSISFRWDMLESFKNYALYAVDSEPIISRSMLYKPINIKNPIVKLKKEHFERWKLFTSQNVGNYAAITIDNQVFSYPKIAGEIGDGSIYQPPGSFLTDKVWSYVLPVIISNLLEHEMKIQWIKTVEPKDSSKL